MEEVLTVNTDGGARGNPGPAACAFVIRKNNKTLYSGSKYLGTTTNNQAEYQGVIQALLYLSENYEKYFVKEIIFILDSELVARQLAGEYKTKNLNLMELLATAKHLERKIKANIIYTVTSRGRNIQADFLVNKELDSQKKISRY